MLASVSKVLAKLKISQKLVQIPANKKRDVNETIIKHLLLYQAQLYMNFPNKNN